MNTNQTVTGEGNAPRDMTAVEGHRSDCECPQCNVALSEAKNAFAKSRRLETLRDPLRQDSLDAERADAEHRRLEQIVGWELDMFLQPIRPLKA